MEPLTLPPAAYLPLIPSSAIPLEIQDGVHFGLSREDYDRIPAISRTMLVKYLDIAHIGENPARFKYWLKTRWENPEKTEALRFGSLVDCLLLEPERFEERYAIFAGKKRQGKAWDEFEASLDGKSDVTQAEYDKAKEIVASLTIHPTYGPVLRKCKKAVLVATVNDIRVKAEIDLWLDEGDTIFDLKTALDCTAAEFGKQAWNLRYHHQAAFYLRLAKALGMEKLAFCFIAVEKEPPFWAESYRLASNGDAVEIAWKHDLRPALQAFANRLRDDDWPSSIPWKHVQFPVWAERQMEVLSKD